MQVLIDHLERALFSSADLKKRSTQPGELSESIAAQVGFCKCGAGPIDVTDESVWYNYLCYLAA